MAARLTKLAYTRDEAASVLSLDEELFSELVECGALPRPRVFYGKRCSIERWSRSVLESVLNAADADSDEFEP